MLNQNRSQSFPTAAIIGASAVVIAAVISIYPVICEEETSCLKYRETRPGEVACNKNTDNGFYWARDNKIKHWPSHGGVTGKGGYPECNEKTVGQVAMAARFPIKHKHLEEVYKEYTTNNSPDFVPECDYYGNPPKREPRNEPVEICGIYQVICTEQ